MLDNNITIALCKDSTLQPGAGTRLCPDDRSLFRKVEKIKNASIPLKKENTHPVSASRHRYTMIPDEIKRADNLFFCRNEFMRYPGGLGDEQAIRYIKIEHDGLSFLIKSRLVRLPSGKRVFVGDFLGKTVTSDGELYHVEDVVPAPAPRPKALLIELLCHLTDIGAQIRDAPRGARQRPRPKPAQASSGRLWSGYFSRLAAPLKTGLHMIRCFLGAAAIPGLFTLADAAHVGEKSLPVTGEADEDEFAGGGHAGFVPSANVTIKPAGWKNHSSQKCRIHFTTPDETIMALWHRETQEYNATLANHQDAFSWLRGFDASLGKKIMHFFNKAEFLSHRAMVINYIMIKRAGEAKLMRCRDLLKKQAILSKDKFIAL